MLSLRLLGGLTLEVDGRTLPAPGGRCGSLLAWLALHPGMQPRSRVAARLWPDVLDESARRSLRTALLDLRGALGPDAGRHLHATRDEVGLEQVWVDVRAFEAAVAEGQLEQALALGEGELLPGFEHDWAYDARDAHQGALAGVIEQLAAEAETRDELAAAIGYTRRLVALDPLAEQPARALIRRLAAAEDRGAALAVYDRHRERLRSDLGMAPSRATRALVEQIRAQPDSPLDVHGPSAPPAPASHADGARPVALPAALIARMGKPLFGRAGELALLAGRLHDVAAGGLRCVVLAGEPGAGKTRLAAELCRVAHAEGATVFYGRCHEDAPFPYAPFVEALRDYVAATAPERVRAEAGHGAAQLAKLVPQLAERLPDDEVTRTTGDPQIEGLRLLDAIMSLIAGAARSAPVVLALEDLHWSDRPTMRVLDHLARTAPQAAILVLGTYRANEVAEDHPLRQTLARLRREGMLEQLPIGGLDEPAVTELAHACSHAPPPPDLVRAVSEATEGNPYFVEEFMRELGDSARGRSQPIGDLLAEVGVPESIQDLIGRRLDRLSDSARMVVATASVIGPEFDIGLLERVTGSANAPLLDALDEALASHVVAELPRSAGRFTFAHTLVRETLYTRLSAVRRARLHGQVALAIEQRYAERLDEHLPALARHCELGGDAGRALRYHRLAGDAAVRLHAADEATEHYSRALQAAAQLGRGGEDPAVYAVRLSRASLLQRAGDLRGALQDAEAAVSGARQARDVRGEIEALNQRGFIRRFDDIDEANACHEAALRVAQDAGDVRAQAATLARLSINLSNQLRLDEGVRLGERALQIAQQTGDDDALALALDAVKLAALQIGDLPVLDEITARLLALHDEAGADWGLHWLDDWVLLERAFVPIAAARWDEALAAAEEALRANRRLRNRFAEPVFRDVLCWIHRSRGDHERAIAYGGEAVDLAQTLGASEWSAWANATLGWTLLEAGDATRAAAHLQRGLAAAETSRAPAQLLRCTALLAWACWDLGERGRALGLSERAEALIAASSAPAGRTFLLGAHAPLAVARVRLADGAPQRAHALVAPVLAAARQAGWLETIAYAALLEGSCQVALGSKEEGSVLIDESLELARSAGLPWIEREAQSKLGDVRAVRR